MNPAFKFRKVVIGGTFDHLHRGHESFLRRAFQLGERVAIGVTSDHFARKKTWPFAILPYGVRLAELNAFLKRENFYQRAEIFKINDPFGPAVTDSALEAILVTSETIKNARRLNKGRIRRGLLPLRILTVPFHKGTDRRRISSARIRLGEEDRKGRVFTSRALVLGGRVLPEEMREFLKKPLGVLYSPLKSTHSSVVFKAISRHSLSQKIVVTVGDVVTSDFIQAGILPALAIADLRVGREKVFASIVALGLSDRLPVPRVINPPGHVSSSLFSTVARAFVDIRRGKRGKAILVLGQEDLAAIPAVLLAPLGSFILYGQPGRGIVAVEVTEKIKHHIFGLLSRFQRP